jgi:hypothetical protein
VTASISPFHKGGARALARPESRRAVAELLCVGGLTPLLYPLSSLLRRSFAFDSCDYAVGALFFYGAYVVNDPHFAVTYLLFYRGLRERFASASATLQRARYVIAGFVVPVVLVAWAGASLAVRSAASIGLLVQVMFLLVGWHYVKQGFGVMTVLAARRGVRWTPAERRALLAHAFAGWAYAWASPADPGTESIEKGVVFRTIPHGASVERVTHAVLYVTVAALVWTLARKWRREGRLPLVTPLVAYLCSIWAWSIYSAADPLVRYVTPALHSLQYLYFVWLLKGNEAREREGAPWFEPARAVRLGILAASAVALGCFLFHLLPSFLDDAFAGRRHTEGDLGPTPYFAALYAVVNIHHYFMDAALWRRENPETRYLYSDVSPLIEPLRVPRAEGAGATGSA